MTPDLSILVCSLIERREQFLKNLLNILEPQCVGKNVELIVIADNAKRTIGQKRNDAMTMANGKYFCFVDDDDQVSADYVDSILAQVPNDSDVIVFNAVIITNGQNPKLVRYGKDFVHGEQTDAYYRKPNHLMVHKKSNVTEQFRDVRFGEDDEWAARRLQTVTTQSAIDKVLYIYDFNTNTRKYQ